ncbi:MAG: inositol monophosphatase family protein [Candidatus Limnocylindria bacterium]
MSRAAALPAQARTAVEAVRAALEVLHARESADKMVAKGGLDMATGTDVRSQEVIQSILERAHPELAFVGEETDADTVPTSGSYWLVDPICGTRNFAYAVPLYSVNVALVEDGEVTIAAVGDGAHGDVWVAARGGGAWLSTTGGLRPAKVSDSSAMVVIDSGRPGGPAASKASRVIAAALRDGRWELRTLGSTLDLAYLAAGRVAGVWHFSRIHPLHFAAGVLLAVEAGAVVTDERAQPWRLDVAEGVVAAATPALHEALMSLLPEDG